MNELAIIVVGADRAGIVADVTGVLARLHLTLIDSTTTLVRGLFAMTLICTGKTSAAMVQESLRALSADNDVVAVVREVRPEAVSTAGGTPYTLVVHGADRLDVVAAMTGAVADAGCNITDLTTRLTGVLYLLSAEVEIPSTVDAEAIADRLDDLADEFGVEVSLRPAVADVL